MALIRTGFIDPKDYPFKKWIDECKHFDCDEHRHKIDTIKVHIADMVGEEHLYCDKSQLCPEGKFRRPKKLIEAERRGFVSVMEMDMADKKAEEDKKAKETEDMKKKLEKSQQDFQALAEHSDASERRFNDYKQTMEARLEALAEHSDTTIRRFDKLATMLQALGGSK